MLRWVFSKKGVVIETSALAERCSFKWHVTVPVEQQTLSLVQSKIDRAMLQRHLFISHAIHVLTPSICLAIIQYTYQAQRSCLDAGHCVTWFLYCRESIPVDRSRKERDIKNMWWISVTGQSWILLVVCLSIFSFCTLLLVTMLFKVVKWIFLCN